MYYVLRPIGKWRMHSGTVAPLVVVSSTVSALIIVDRGKILNTPEAALEHRYGRPVLLSPRLGSAAPS